MREEKQQEDVCRVVLLAMQAHPKCVGVDALALLLKGSRSKRLAVRKLHESRFFGSLFYHARRNCELRKAVPAAWLSSDNRPWHNAVSNACAYTY